MGVFKQFRPRSIHSAVHISLFASVFAQSDAKNASRRLATKNKCSSTEQTHVHFVFKNIRWAYHSRLLYTNLYFYTGEVTRRFIYLYAF